MPTHPAADRPGPDEHQPGDEAGDEAEELTAADTAGPAEEDAGGEAEEEAGEDEGTDAAAPVVMTGWQRMTQTFVNPPKPKSVEAIDFSQMTDDEIRARINQIDGTERKIGLAATWLAVLLTLLATLPDLLSSKPVYGDVAPTKGKCPAHATYFPAKHGALAYCHELVSRDVVIISMVVGLVLAAGIYLCVRWGRRSAVAFMVGFTGIALSSVNTIAALPFIIAAIWLVVRAYRTQKNGAPNARSPLAGYRRPPPRSRRSGTTSGAAPASKTASKPSGSGGSRAKPAPSAPKSPSQNKRYTPKAPAKKKPPAT